MPYLNKPILDRSWRRWIWGWDQKARVDKSIESFPAPIKAGPGKSITFEDGSTYEADLVVFATGYKQTFPFLHPAPPPAGAKDATEEAYPVMDDWRVMDDGKRDASASAASAGRRRHRSPPRCSLPPGPAADADASAHDSCSNGAPGGDGAASGMGHAAGWVPCTGARGVEDPLPSEHFIVSPTAPRLAFIGFVRPNVGAIPPMAELQVMWWIQRLRGQVRRGHLPSSYGLLGKKLTYGVDYGNYMHQVAAEIDAAPTLTTLLASPRALIAYAFGQAYISFFRLQGPFRSAHAWRTAETELFEPVLSRGVAANAIFVATMLLFAWMNLIAHAVEWTLWLVAPKFVERKRREAYHDLP